MGWLAVCRTAARPRFISPIVELLFPNDHNIRLIVIGDPIDLVDERVVPRPAAEERTKGFPGSLLS
jgi:hypothetical protein